MNAHFSKNQSSYLKKMWPFYAYFEKCEAFIFFIFLFFKCTITERFYNFANPEHQS